MLRKGLGNIHWLISTGYYFNDNTLMDITLLMIPTGYYFTDNTLLILRS